MTTCASSLFSQTFYVLGLLKLRYSSVTNLGSNLVTGMAKANNREGFQMDAKPADRRMVNATGTLNHG